jgi:hypothetical protein
LSSFSTRTWPSRCIGVIADPQADYISAYQPEREGPAAEDVFVCDELGTTDADDAQRFYEEVFDWTTSDIGPDYGGLADLQPRRDRHRPASACSRIAAGKSRYFCSRSRFLIATGRMILSSQRGALPVVSGLIPRAKVMKAARRWPRASCAREAGVQFVPIEPSIETPGS